MEYAVEMNRLIKFEMEGRSVNHSKHKQADSGT